MRIILNPKTITLIPSSKKDISRGLLIKSPKLESEALLPYATNNILKGQKEYSLPTALKQRDIEAIYIRAL